MQNDLSAVALTADASSVGDLSAAASTSYDLSAVASTADDSSIGVTVVAAALFE